MNPSPLPHKYILLLSFKGTNYYGWQIQPKSISVQSVLNKAISTLLREDINTCGAGRTDKGVHASFFVAHFESSSGLLDKDQTFVFKLNRILPKDISIHSISKTRDDFHARYSATARTYHYLIAKNKTCFLDEFSSYIYGDLDIHSMNQAAEMLKEYNDFTSFSRLHGSAKTNICKVSESVWFEKNGFLIYKITADRFLRNMVRALVGTMLDVGTGKINISGFRNIIEKKDRSSAGTSAEAKGLFLTGIAYPEEFGIIEAWNEFPGFLIHMEVKSR